MTSQLTLSLLPSEQFSFSNFISGDNETLITAMKNVLGGGKENFIYMCGPEGSGRSHLLQAACQWMNTQKGRSVYLPFEAQSHLSPALLENLEHLDLVCIDDIDEVLGNSKWETALFDFYNRLRDQQTRLIVSASSLPSHLKGVLPDLVSRLAWGLCFQVKPLQDADKIVALKTRAKKRGMELTDEVAHYLLRHYSRQPKDLFALLSQLDHASLREQRRLTIPFVKSVMGVSS
ncbi:MAG TPA: DnaA regulatory inactivator Hda [Coxiellaceae bacterium]|nr:DnaA regulatory inactivator Hda [Coxiellaceae bacterium]